jgi:hypothetical protein
MTIKKVAQQVTYSDEAAFRTSGKVKRHTGRIQGQDKL